MPGISLLPSPRPILPSNRSHAIENVVVLGRSLFSLHFKSHRVPPAMRSSNRSRNALSQTRAWRGVRGKRLLCGVCPRSAEATAAALGGPNGLLRSAGTCRVSPLGLVTSRERGCVVSNQETPQREAAAQLSPPSPAGPIQSLLPLLFAATPTRVRRADLKTSRPVGGFVVFCRLARKRSGLKRDPGAAAPDDESFPGRWRSWVFVADGVCGHQTPAVLFLQACPRARWGASRGRADAGPPCSAAMRGVGRGAGFTEEEEEARCATEPCRGQPSKRAAPPSRQSP